MTRTRCTMYPGFQGELYMRRVMAPTDAARALIKATGWLFCLGDLDGVDDLEGGAM